MQHFKRSAPANEVEYVTERLVLRLPRADGAGARDAAAALDYYTVERAELEPLEPRRPEGFYTLDFWNWQVQQIRLEHEAGQSLRIFVFENSAPTRMIGAVNFTRIQRGAAWSCNLGYSLARDRRGHGLMTEALRAGVAHACGPMRMHRVMANYMPRNERSGRLLERLGFVREGLARDFLLINGRWEDHVLMSYVNADWKAPE